MRWGPHGLPAWKEEGLRRHPTPPPLCRSEPCPREMSQRTGANLEWGPALAPMEEKAGGQSPGELARACPARTGPGCPGSSIGLRWRLQLLCSHQLQPIHQPLHAKPLGGPWTTATLHRFNHPHFVDEETEVKALGQSHGVSERLPSPRRGGPTSGLLPLCRPA